MANKLLKFSAGLQFVLIAVLILRLFFAYEWMTAGVEKLQSIYSDSAGFFFQFKNVFSNVWAKSNPYPIMVSFLKDFATPNAGMIITTIAISETTLGILFLLGLFVRPASIIAMIQSAIFFLAAGHTSPSTAGINFIMFGGELFLLLTSAGRAYGLDAVLHKKFPKLKIF